MKVFTSLLVATAALLAACLMPGMACDLATPADSLPQPPDKTLPAEADRLALCLFRDLARTQEGNVCFSPATMEQLLFLLRVGAGGETYAALDALPFAMPEKVTSGASFALGLFVDDTLPHTEGLGVLGVPFRTHPRKAAETINRWCHTMTMGRIPRIVSADSLPADTRLLAASACHLQQEWLKPFDTHDTRAAVPFLLRDGSTQPVDMMRQMAHFRYAESEQWQAVALSYRDSSYPGSPLHFIGILPKGDARAFAQQFDTKQYDAIRSALMVEGFQEVIIELPRLELDCFHSFREALRRLGAGVLFAPGLDLSHLVQAEGLMVEDILQQSRISVTEEKTVAASAAFLPSIVIGSDHTAPPPPKRIRFDRPFIWSIDRLTGKDSPAFMGFVTKPSSHHAPPPHLRAPATGAGERWKQYEITKSE